MNSKKGIICLIAAAAVGAAQTASAQTLNSTSIVGYATAHSGGIDSLQYVSNSDNTTAFAQVNDLQFNGLDGSNNPQTMTFSGWTSTRSDYGQLHTSTYATVNNNYYNVNNPDFDPGTGTGSPTSVDSLGIAQFTDTLQFGGLLSTGYTARYVFHIDGTVTGNMIENQGGVMGVTLPGAYFIQAWFGNGNYNTDFATGQVSIDGSYAQSINVQFDSQAYVDNSWYADGSNITGAADFSDTSTLVGIELRDPNGNLVTSGVTITGASGTSYALLATPEPSGWAALGVGVLGLLRLRRKR